MANSLRVDTDALSGAGQRIGTAAPLPSETFATVTAPAADNVSVTVAQGLSARVHTISTHSAAAAVITATAGRVVGRNAATYADRDRRNATVLRPGAGGPGPSGAPLGVVAPGPVAAPPVPSLPAGVTPTDAKTIARLIHGGPGPGSLLAAADHMRAHARDLRATAARLTSARTTMAGVWQSAAGDAAVHKIARLTAWYDGHADAALDVARHADGAADNFARAKAVVPRLEEIEDLERRLLAATRANVLARGAYSTVVADLLVELNALRAKALKGFAEYGSHAEIGTDISTTPPRTVHALDHPLSPFDDDDFDDDEEFPDGLPGVPEDPKAFHDWWNSLTPEEKDLLFAADPFIGNHDGMPFVDRDHYNRLNLAQLQAANQAELDALRAEHPDWAAGDNPFFASREWQDWKSAWDQANTSHREYEQVLKALQSPDGLPRYLGVIDDDGHAAVAINNPDTARRVATFVPGTGQDVGRLEFSTDKARAMWEATMNADRSLRPGDVSITTWMGYDRPMSVIPEAASPSYAHDGAGALQDFQAGLRASHDDVAAGGASINTVIGHSYGSTVMGAAGLDGYLDANNVVAVGSPGILADHAGDLHLPSGAHVFATRAQNDIIGAVTGLTLGPDPMLRSFGGIPFEAADGPSGPFGLPSIAAHSSYWDNMNNPALINLGRIIAGRTDVTPPHFTP